MREPKRLIDDGPFEIADALQQARACATSDAQLDALWRDISAATGGPGGPGGPAGAGPSGAPAGTQALGGALGGGLLPSIKSMALLASVTAATMFGISQWPASNVVTTTRNGQPGTQLPSAPASPVTTEPVGTGIPGEDSVRQPHRDDARNQPAQVAAPPDQASAVRSQRATIKPRAARPPHRTRGLRPPARAASRQPTHEQPANSAADPAFEETPEIQLIERADVALQPEPALALRLLEAHLRQHPRGALAQERELMRIEALLALGRHDEARALASTFATQFPQSPHRRRVEDLLR